MVAAERIVPSMVGRILTSEGYTVFSNLGWRTISPNGIHGVFLQRSQWSDLEKYYLTMCFYPAEYLRLQELPRKRPRPENYPIQVRFEALLRADPMRKYFEDALSLVIKMEVSEREQRISSLMINHALPMLRELNSLQDVIKLARENRIPLGSVRMPVLAEIDDSLRPRLADYAFIEGELLQRD
ncbi:DUF4304 domain-containing protein [Frigidibacter sp. SD6-1]|uniref:DUF4304 domain-containing protein n=1 Tax=Frigidibacter sp. SD6-1 TaxID=3032581 RepID=UPI0024DF712F|nr:DUF4304 domain-containing protein [Frigidibacter sp. SD6-1]